MTSLTRRFRPTPLRRFSVAVFSVVFVLILKLFLNPFLDIESPFLLFFSAIVISAWYGGFEPGLLASALAALLADYFFVSPINTVSLSLGEILGVSLFIIEGLIISTLSHTLRKSYDRLAEENLVRQQAQQSLKDSEERFRLLVEGVKDYAIFGLDPQGYIISWNVGAQRIKGYQANEIIGQHFSVFYSTDDIQAGKPARALEVAVTEGAYRAEGWRLRRDGSRFMADVLITALYDGTGKLRGFSKVTRDITERKQLEAEFLQAELLRREVQSERVLVELKESFISMVSHEFRTPLTLMLSTTDLLEAYQDRLSPQQKQEHMRNIRQQILHMNAMLNEVLTVGKARAGKTEVQRVPLDIEHFCRTLLEQMRTATSSSHQFVFTAQGSLEDISLDESLMQHILVNLLSNAVKYSPLGSDIHLEVFTEGEEIIFRVRDTGIGIPTKDQERLFEPFFRAKNAKDIQGTGLGLVIVNDSVQAQGGMIQVKSEEGVGTTFTVRLPKH